MELARPDRVQNVCDLIAAVIIPSYHVGKYDFIFMARKTIPCIWNRTHVGHTHVHRDNNALWYFGMWWTAGHLVCFSYNTLYFWNDKQQPVAISALSQHRCHDWVNRNRSRLSSALGRHAALDTRCSSTHWALKVEGYLLCCSGIPLAGFFKNLLHNRLIAVEGCT